MTDPSSAGPIAARPGATVGIELTNNQISAAVFRDGMVEPLNLSDGSNPASGQMGMPAAVAITESGPVAGEAALAIQSTNPAVVAQGFVNQLGTSGGLTVGAVSYTPEQLTGIALSEAMLRVQRHLGGRPASIAISYPGFWEQHRVSAVSLAASQAGYPNPDLVPSPAASVASHRERFGPGEHVVVYDRFGDTYEAAVVRNDPDPQVVGSPEAIDPNASLEDNLAALDRTVASAGLTWATVGSVLLVGAATDIASISPTVASHTGRPIITTTDPQHVVSTGAAAAAAYRPMPIGAVVPPVRQDKKPSTGAAVAVILVTAVIGVAVALLLLNNDDGDETVTEPGDTSTSVPDDSTTTSSVPDDSTTTVPDSTTTEPTDSTTTVPDTTTTEPDDTTTTTEPVDTTTTTTTVPEPEPVTMQVCVANSDVRAATGALTITRERGAATYPNPGSDCSIDLDSGTPLPGADPDTGYDRLAISGGITVLGTSNDLTVVAGDGSSGVCSDIGGEISNGDGGMIPNLDGSTVRWVTLAPDGCSTTDVGGTDGIDASHVAGAGSQVAIAGSADGSGALWFASLGAAEITPGPATTNLGDIDALTACGSNWCTVDLDEELIHVVSGSGEIIAVRSFGGGLPNRTTDIASIAPGSGTDVWMVVEVRRDGNALVRVSP